MEELVLIVDDDERNAKLVRVVLEAAGLQTISAGTAAEALALAAEHGPALVLMDLRLPDLGGVEAAERLAEGERTAHIPVVALSAEPAAEAASWLHDTVFAGYLEKPIDVQMFPEQVRQHLGGG
jgi:two-component system, cell cycle response regulator DivK